MRRHSTYSEQRKNRITFRRRLLILFLVYVAFEFVTAVFLTPYRVESDSMSPTLSPGDYVMTFPLAFGVRSAFLRNPIPGVSSPRRGELVVVEAPFYERSAWYAEAADSILRFFTFQRIGIVRKGSLNGISVKRVIAVPGDSLYLMGNQVMVRTAESDHYLTEYEVSGRVYETDLDPAPKGWSRDFPLSGSYPEIQLEEGQYFVLGDNRTSALDSRAYGPVDSGRFVARVLFRYWPFRNFGRP